MLGRRNYSDEEIKAAEVTIGATIRAYKSLPATAKTQEFENAYFNRSVLLLDYLFVHRLTGIEGKDGNPLNEVRVLCNSIVLNNGKLQAEPLSDWPMSAGRGLKLPAEKSILKLQNGDEVKLNEAGFSRLAAAFFAELRKRFS